MKKFKDIKTVGMFCCHDNKTYLKKSLDNIAKYCNAGIYINLNEATPEVSKIVKNHPSVTKWIETTNGGKLWSQGNVRTETVRMLDDIMPDIVINFDDDETSCNNLQEQLKKFWEDEQKKTFWFNGLYMWGDENHFRRDGLYKSMWNCRIFKWQPEITYNPYAGRGMPTTYANLPREAKYFSDRPLFHYGYMTEEDRALKYKRNNSQACDPEFRKKRDKTIIIKEVPEELKKI